MPVVVLSSLTPKNSDLALKALDLGAVEVLCKPGAAYSTKNISHHLALAVRSAAAANMNNHCSQFRAAAGKVQTSNLLVKTTHKVIAIGASTGGTKAIESVLSDLPATAPGIVIVQHMPEHFTTSFAKRLDEICPMQVREARDNDHVASGVALIAPGNQHMVLTRKRGTYTVRIKSGPRVHYQRPSVDVLFQSVAKSVACNAVGVMLTGMGADGAKGMLAMKESGAYTLAQDEATCVVYGMPKEAVKLGAVDEIVPLPGIPQALISVLERDGKPRQCSRKGG